MAPTDRKADRHRGKLRGVRFDDDEWAALEQVAEQLGTRPTTLVRDCGLYLIGRLDEQPQRPD